MRKIKIRNFENENVNFVKLVVLITVKIYKFDSFRTDSFFDFFIFKK